MQHLIENAMIKHFYILLIICLFSCKEPNTRLEKYSNFPETKYKPFFSIASSLPNDHALTYPVYFSDLKKDTAQFEIWVHHHKMYAKTIQPESNEFILFDFNSKLNETKKIEFKNTNLTKSFDCVLEEKINTKQFDTVYRFRLKKSCQLNPFFGGDQVDTMVLVTLKHAVIGSFLTDLDATGMPMIFIQKGNLLTNSFDYSKYRDVVLE